MRLNEITQTTQLSIVNQNDPFDSTATWITRQRAIRTESAAREGTKALHETSLLLGKARAAPEGELTAWAEASQASRRAEAMLSRPELTPDLRGRIRDLSAMVARERQRAEARSKDRRMAERLATIHADMAMPSGWARADHAYTSAFRDYGIDLERLEPAEAGALVAKAPIAVELVNALDQWTFLHRGVPPHAPSLQARYLSEVARVADPDPWRCRLREALELPPSESSCARGIFEELAASAPGDLRYRESISRLAFALRVLGDHNLAIALLRRIQRAHPDDFWINFDLASSLQRAGHPHEAVRFFSAAIAIRPRSEIALGAIEEALREAGRPDEAAAYARRESKGGIPAL